MKNILNKENILVNLPKTSKEQAIKFAGEKLLELGYVESQYIDSMLKRENNLTTYIGNFVAIPHGDEGSGNLVKQPGIVIHHYQEPIEFIEPVHFIIGIASNNDLHLEVLSLIAEKFSDLENVKKTLNNISEELLFNEFKMEG